MERFFQDVREREAGGEQKVKALVFHGAEYTPAQPYRQAHQNAL